MDTTPTALPPRRTSTAEVAIAASLLGGVGGGAVASSVATLDPLLGAWTILGLLWAAFVVLAVLMVVRGKRCG